MIDIDDVIDGIQSLLVGGVLSSWPSYCSLRFGNMVGRYRINRVFVDRFETFEP